jgi:hypothetical protein
MKYFMLVRADAPDHYTAQAVGFPEIRAEGRTEEEAVEGARQSLSACLAAAKLVPVEITANGANPWLIGFGRSASDPDFEEYLGEIQRARDLESIE